MKEVIMNVKNIMCAGCENEIRNAFKDVRGIIDLEPSHKTKTVTVKYDESIINIPEIKSIIEKTGRKVNDFKEIK
ncbi:MAG: heavy-metal-associated domain-containing protein [Elusimicrobiales bacterium]|jgi:copper chaperone CopZ|nr:heavy-metal-associated domain-containing protein [Elusimicrobiales bacterium]NLH39390.1 heavy-metal-associated domain-containing protein [Elusimicrobiota bacterium]